MKMNFDAMTVNQRHQLIADRLDEHLVAGSVSDSEELIYLIRVLSQTLADYCHGDNSDLITDYQKMLYEMADDLPKIIVAPEAVARSARKRLRAILKYLQQTYALSTSHQFVYAWTIIAGAFSIVLSIFFMAVTQYYIVGGFMILVITFCGYLLGLKHDRVAKEKGRCINISL